MMKPTFKTETLTPKQREKMLVRNAYHDGFRAACEAMRRVFAPEHKAIRKIINAVDHVQGEPSMMRLFRSELRGARTLVPGEHWRFDGSPTERAEARKRNRQRIAAHARRLKRH